jgi:hypothetical protein
MAAAAAGQVGTVVLLIRHGAGVNAKDVVSICYYCYYAVATTTSCVNVLVIPQIIRSLTPEQKHASALRVPTDYFGHPQRQCRHSDLHGVVRS